MGELGLGAAQPKAEAESSGIWEGMSTSQNALPISSILIIWGFMISFMFQKPQSSQLQFRFFSASDVREKKKKGRKRREWQSKEKDESQGSSSEGDADQASLNDGQTGQRFGKSMESLK